MAWAIFPVNAWGYAWGCDSQEQAIARAEHEVRRHTGQTPPGALTHHWAQNWWLVLAHNGLGAFAAAASSSRRKAEKEALGTYDGRGPAYRIELSFHAASGKGRPR